MVSPSCGSRMFDHQPHDAARRVELAGLLVGGVGELLDQVLVGLAEDVGFCGFVAQAMPEKCSIRSRSSASESRSLFVHWASPKMP